MAFVIADRVRETSTTTGTGNFTLAGAVDRFRTFDSVLDTGDTTYYTIADQSGVGWEVGIATFTSPSTLARTTILSSSNGGSAVDFGAGSKDVFITLPASRTVTSVDGGSTGLTPSTASYGAISFGGTLVAANGGTGQSSYTIGDLLYASGTTALSKLADVATGSALISGGVGVAPSWDKIGLTTHVSGTLPVANGGTNGTTAAAGFDNLAPTTTQGDIIYRNATTNTRLAAGTTSQVLIGGTTPSWGAVTLTSMVTGTLPVGNGGTGTATAFTAGSVVFAGASGVYNQDNTNLFWDDTNNRLGIGTSSPGSALDVKGTLRLSGSTSGYVGLAPAAAAGSTTYTLPSADGTSGQVLSTNGSGTLSWASGGGTGTLKNVQVFTSSGTYTRTSGVTAAVVVAVGGGGGGKGARNDGAGGNGGNGGTTSFGSHVSAAGGSGSTGLDGGAGGTGGSGATIAIPGQGGGCGGNENYMQGKGGGQGGGLSKNSQAFATAGTAGSRGGGGSGGSTAAGYGGGGQGETCIKYTTTVGSTETVTIGAGGAGGTTNNGSGGGAGGAGYIIVYEYS